ncbi:hypothetical protein PHLGIDRAFT_25547 [Phlebiopsis gigantea 11061_1 CR5-6]|uniref:Uncharacterized protein n=1 Tax=Phlebiopsis gigantea (strain 11061_1 CR5-6) TaxID=745531 RepID=A0A0C3PFX6_PHLG1|nr:hypothetical protein PHLGIDRAFT_25547 [Phlebiopsis gigantea 11061_1 CR5-6]
MQQTWMPRIEWNAERELLLWEVIAKSRVAGAGGTNWKGLASHLQVPLPYLLYRAQVRYEEDLRGLRTALSPISPAPQAATAKPGSPPAPAGGERDSSRAGTGPLSASTSGRPLAIRTRLNSLGNIHRSINSPQKVTSSSVITLQGPKRTHAPLRPLSPTSSRPSPSSPSSGADGGDEDEEEEEEMRRYEEEEKRLEEQQALDQKLRELEQKLTKESIGLVSSPPKPSFSRREVDRGRMRPLSSSSVSSSLHQRLDFSRRHSASHTPSHHSLSSASSPQGSIPDIPSPPSETSQPSSPVPRHLSPVGPSRSPPAVSHGNAFGTVRGPSVYRRATLGGNVRSERGSEIGSAASSFSDLSGKCGFRQSTKLEG